MKDYGLFLLSQAKWILLLFRMLKPLRMNDYGPPPTQSNPPRFFDKSKNQAIKK